MKMTSERKLTDIEAAEVLGVKVSTLRKWRLFRRGPEFIKIGARLVRYLEADLERYLSERPRGGGR